MSIALRGRRVLALLFAAAAWAAAAPAHAQIMSNPAQWYINNQIYSQRVFNGTIANSMTNAASSRAAGLPAGANASAAGGGAPPVDVTRFTAAGGPRLPAALAAREGGGPQAQRAARERYESYLEMYSRTAAKDRFPADDLAYAYQYYVVNNWQIVHDLVDVPLDQDPRLRGARDGFERIELASRKRQEQVTPLQERAIYAHFREQLAANAEVRRMTDAQKQEAAEMLAISLGVNFTGYTQGLERGDDALAQQSRDLARAGLEKLLGRPIDRIRIDERGMVLQ